MMVLEEVLMLCVYWYNGASADQYRLFTATVTRSSKSGA